MSRETKEAAVEQLLKRVSILEIEIHNRVCIHFLSGGKNLQLNFCKHKFGYEIF